MLQPVHVGKIFLKQFLMVLQQVRSVYIINSSCEAALSSQTQTFCPYLLIITSLT